MKLSQKGKGDTPLLPFYKMTLSPYRPYHLIVTNYMSLYENKATPWSFSSYAYACTYLFGKHTSTRDILIFMKLHVYQANAYSDTTLITF